MINPQWLELPMSGTYLQGPKDVRVIEVRLLFEPLSHITTSSRSCSCFSSADRSSVTALLKLFFVCQLCYFVLSFFFLIFRCLGKVLIVIEALTVYFHYKF